MDYAVPTDNGQQPFDALLQAELVRADALVGSLGTVLRHLLANDDQSLFSDEIVARLRGMLASLARQLLAARALAGGADPVEAVEREGEALAGLLLRDAALLGHLHAMALEWQLTSRLQMRQGIDPVLTPLLQELIGSGDAALANPAMVTLAAQARFAQHQRRMELPLGELPGDLFHGALLTLAALGGTAEQEAAERSAENLRKTFDESRSRLGLLARLLTGLGTDSQGMLALDHAGVAFFVTALGLAAGLERDLAVLSTNDRQTARLVLALRAAGLSPTEVAEQFAQLHPGLPFPGDFEDLRQDRASEILASSSPVLQG